VRSCQKNLHTASIQNAAGERESEIKRFRLPLFRSNRVFVSSSACAARNSDTALAREIFIVFSRAASTSTYAILDTVPVQRSEAIFDFSRGGRGKTDVTAEKDGNGGNLLQFLYSLY